MPALRRTVKMDFKGFQKVYFLTATLLGLLENRNLGIVRKPLPEGFLGFFK